MNFEIESSEYLGSIENFGMLMNTVHSRFSQIIYAYSNVL